MIISLGCDHAGYHLKAVVMDHLRKSGHEVLDHGCYSPEPVDFPDIAKLVCGSVSSGAASRGLLLCGTGVGACIAANKMPGIRASVCHDIHSAHQCVEHDDVNVMCLGGQIVGAWLATDLIDAFLQATFLTDEPFRRRVEKLKLMDGTAENEQR